jgi:putative spermidine/putrescine transport system substrate-binding protein
MKTAGTLDTALFEALPPVSGTPVFLTDAQTKAANTYLAANWAKAIG